MEEDNSFLLLIDGSSLLTTQFYGNLPRDIMFAKTLEEKEEYFPKIMQTKDGHYTNAVFGFVRTLVKILKEQKPTHLAVAWDVSRNTFRRELYADYKANRGELLLPLRDQFILCQYLLSRFGVPQLMDLRYEADDFCGTLAARFEKEIPVCLMTKDNDYLQLVSEQTKLWLMHGTAEKTAELYKKYHIDMKKVNAPDRCFLYTPELVEMEFGIRPENVNSLKGIQGDSSDNIKGVPGVGEATARILIAKYHTVDNIYKELNGKDKKELDAVKEQWKTELGLKRSPISYLLKTNGTGMSGEASARLSEELATIKKDIPVGDLKLGDLRVGIDIDAAQRVCAALEFKTVDFAFAGDGGQSGKRGASDLVYGYNQAVRSGIFTAEAMEALAAVAVKEGKVLLEDAPAPKPESPAELVEDPKKAGEFFALLSAKGKNTVGLQAFTDGRQLFGLSVTEPSGRTCFILSNSRMNAAFLREKIDMLAAAGCRFAVFDWKEQMKFFPDIPIGQIWDLGIAAYLLNPVTNSYGYDSISEEYLGEKIGTYQDMFGKQSLGDLFNTEENGQITMGFGGDGASEQVKAFVPYAGTISRTACKAASLLIDRLKEEEMYGLYTDIEMPLVRTLYDMEARGIRVNKEDLAEYGQMLDEKMKEYEEQIYRAAGEEFNINSPKQLGVILFDKLHLPYGKKTKSGYSTSADVLERLRQEDPIVSLILDYRQVAKLKSTYADGLAVYIEQDGRIHGKFHQTIAATGRISSTEPNLQNIPVRMELGRQIRRVFIPEEGYIFINADYSQIELRVLAHMSGDKRLIEAYKSAQDIHRITASQVFHTPFEEVTAQQRSNAKAVNFGIVYGISSFGLGQGLGISKKEAEQYISQYFATYPGVKEFMDGLVALAKDQGFVTTIFQRRRPIPELDSTNFMQRQFGERVAMNSPIQGTAADIIKIAMIRVNDRLKRERLKSRLLLQIHDELLIETKTEELEQVRDILEQEMTHAADMEVALEVDVNTGNNWYELK